MIALWGLWQKVQFGCSFESKSKQDFIVRTAAKGSIWHLDFRSWSRSWSITTKSFCRAVLNQRANRIHVRGLWKVIQFDIWSWNCRTWSIIVLNQRTNRIQVRGLWKEIQCDIWTWNGRTWSITTKSYCKIIFNQRVNRIHVRSLWQEIQWHFSSFIEGAEAFTQGSVSNIQTYIVSVSYRFLAPILWFFSIPIPILWLKIWDRYQYPEQGMYDTNTDTNTQQLWYVSSKRYQYFT